MGIPITYNLRNLVERKATTLMTALGIALTVGVLVTALGLIQGLRSTFAQSAHPLQVVVMRKGVTAELNSAVMEAAYREIRQMPGVARGADGEPLASPECLTVVNLPSVDSPSGMNLTVRGLLPVGAAMRDAQLRDGRWWEPGRREMVVGESVMRRYPDARLGGRLRFGRGEWDVVGVFAAGQGMSAANSEIWCDLNQLRGDFDRQGNMSSVLVRATDESALTAFMKALEDNRRLNATSMRESAYYAKMTSSGAPLMALGLFVAIIMSIGSGFAAMNTMYAAVARRVREIGTLRALGFSRLSILSSFMLESVALALFGGMLGCLIALPLNNVTTGVGNFETFSEIAFNFRVGPAAMLPGLVFAVVIGAVGGFLPALAAARKDPLSAMREP